MAELSPDELGAYQRDGYVIPEFRLSEEKLNCVSAALEEVIEANPEVRPEHLVSIHITNGQGTTLKGHPAFLDLALDEEILDLVAGVVGDNVIMWGCQAFCKPATDGMEVPMHQDGQYWPIRPLATCTVWLALDDANRDNGCLTVLPGSHREKQHFNHTTRSQSNLVLNQAAADDRLQCITPKYVELERGQMSLHDVYLVHGSAPNTSGRRRAGVALRYMPSTSEFCRDIPMPYSGYPVDFASRPIWLARGKDVSGNNDLNVGHD